LKILFGVKYSYVDIDPHPPPQQGMEGGERGRID